MRLNEARAHIQERRLTLDMARGQLSLLRDSAHLLRLFEEVFPDTFAAPIEPEREPEGILGNVPRKVQRFFDTVRAKLFPLPDFYFAVDELEDWLVGVPFWPLLPDPYDLEIGDVPTYYKLALALMDDDLRRGVFGETLGDDRAAAFLSAGTRIDAGLLKRMCERAGGPLADFVLALDVVTRDTGNGWLDISPEESGAYHYEWTAETLNFLAEAYRQADEIMKRVDAFDDWLDEDPANIETAIAFWMRAAGDRTEDDRQMVLMVNGVPLLSERPEFEAAAMAAA